MHMVHVAGCISQPAYLRATGTFSAGGYVSSQSIEDVSGYGSTSASEYIYILGGPNTGSSMESLKSGFSGSNIYDADSNRQSNLEYNLESGVTVEFWIKKDNWCGINAAKETSKYDPMSLHLIVNHLNLDEGELNFMIDGYFTSNTDLEDNFFDINKDGHQNNFIYIKRK